MGVGVPILIPDTMRAWVLRDPGQLALIDKPVPKPGPAEVLVRVDAVAIFDESSPEAALERLRPDIWVKGGDYTENDLPEAGVVRRHGGEVVLLPTVVGYSSSNPIAAANRTHAARS